MNSVFNVRTLDAIFCILLYFILNFVLVPARVVTNMGGIHRGETIYTRLHSKCKIYTRSKI